MFFVNLKLLEVKLDTVLTVYSYFAGLRDFVKQRDDVPVYQSLEYDVNYQDVVTDMPPDDFVTILPWTKRILYYGHVERLFSSFHRVVVIFFHDFAASGRRTCTQTYEVKSAKNGAE